MDRWTDGQMGSRIFNYPYYVIQVRDTTSHCR
jgi:hypothetical protein